MRMMAIELKKEKRSGVIPVMLLVGILGAGYAYANFFVRKETLLSLPLPPMDILLTQLYGVISIFNLFGIVVTTCIMYNIEFSGGAIKKTAAFPISISGVYLSKFLIATILFLVAIALQNLALAQIGVSNLPSGAFVNRTAVNFAAYSFITSMPVLSFMLLISSLFENMWVPLGVGVAGFLSSMALSSANGILFMLNPFIVLLKPAFAMSSAPDLTVILFAVIETLLFLILGVGFAKYRRYE